MARILGINRKTVVRKLLFWEVKANHLERQRWENQKAQGTLITDIQMDEMESFERTKCLPLSIALVVEAKTRKIIDFRVGSMPAKGLLAAKSLKKYGPRKDQRAEMVDSLFAEIKPYVHPLATISTDENPRYPGWIQKHFSEIKHQKFKGRRACSVGQGELKRGGFDPLFALNHTCAMIRAHVSRLFRRTWNTTKKAERLAAHLSLYVHYHNTVLT